MKVLSDKEWLSTVAETVESAPVQSRSGLLAHALIAENVSTLTAHDAETAPEVLLTAADRILDLTGMNWSMKNRTRAEAVTAACRYITRLAPLRATWLGSEIPLDHSIPDLAWWTPAGVFFDEIKTGNIGTRGFASGVIDQAARQASDGQARAGDAFIGVRLIPIRMPQAAILVTADGRAWALVATSVSIEAMRKGIR
jgi:hypothetical protein